MRTYFLYIILGVLLSCGQLLSACCSEPNNPGLLVSFTSKWLIAATVVILLFMMIIYRFYKHNKRVNKELLQKNKEISRHREDLLEAKRKAEESDRLKSAFLTNMSHEIRTPMNSIIGFSSLLGIEELNKEKKQKYLSIIESNGRKLVNLIDEIIDLSKLEANQLKLYPEECTLHRELEAMTQQFKQELAHSNKSYITIRLVIPNEGRVKSFITDIMRVKQVLFNLLMNAVKFTKKGVIEFGYTYRDSTIHFFVKDTGIGISDKDKHLIFKQFRQVDEGEDREYGGTGHGLALCKGLVNLMGGEIWYESERHKGTVFYFTIPARQAVLYSAYEQISVCVPPLKEYRWLKKNVLIVEDEDENYILLKELLRDTGVRIHRAANGQEAVDMIRNKHPADIVIMDIKMPVMDGYEATRQIKSWNNNIPVIAQTAFALPDEQSYCMQAGCDGYISKPIRSRDLLEIIDPFLSADKKP